MKNSNEEYYTGSVTELADIVPVITSQEVFSDTGMKLVNKGIRLNSSFFERLGRHNILPPLEQCLIVENGVTSAEIVTIAQQLLEIDPPQRDSRIDLHLSWHPARPAAAKVN